MKSFFYNGNLNCRNRAEMKEKSQGILNDTRKEYTQGLGGNQLLKLTANENVKKMVKFIVETTFDV